MSWFVVDDQAFQHPKHQALMRRGLAGDADALGAGYLWVLAGSRIKAALGEGTLDRYDLLQLVPDPERVFRMAGFLVEVGLWHDAGHGCDRCEPVEPGQYRFHDWSIYHKRSNADERMIKALREERNDPRLHAAVWERDRLPIHLKQAPEGPDEAVCAYCEQRLSRSTRKGELRPEIDHVLPRPLGVDNLVISCAGCNRKKGQRPPKAAGLTLHLTRAHEEALTVRDARSHPTGSAGLRAAMMASDEGLLDQELDTGQDSPERPEGVAGQEPDSHRSHPERPARSGLPDGCSHPSDPTASAGCHPSGPGSRTPASAGQENPGICSSSDDGSGLSDRVTEPAEQSQPPAPRHRKKPYLTFNGRSLPISGPRPTPVDALGQNARPQAHPDVRALVGPFAEPADVEEPHARTGVRAHVRPHAPALTGARALAGQGRAGVGTGRAGQGPAGPGRVPDQEPSTDQPADRPPRPRRRRKRGKRKAVTTGASLGTCVEHGDYLPCRLCDLGELEMAMTEEER